MKYLVSILLCFCVVNLSAQPPEQNLNGPVKFLVTSGKHMMWNTFFYKFDKAGCVIEERCFTPIDNNFTLDTTTCKFNYGRSWSYDENGRVISNSFFDENKVLSETTKKYYKNCKEEILEIYYNYESDLTIIDTLSYAVVDSASNTLKKFYLETLEEPLADCTYTLDTLDCIINRVCKSENGSEIWVQKFNAAHFPILQKGMSIKESDTTTIQVLFKYNSKNELILKEEIISGKPWSSKSIKDSFVHCKNGSIEKFHYEFHFKENSFSRENSYSLQYSEVYDAIGNTLKYTNYDKLGKKSSTTQYSYEFDNYNNWIMVTPERNGELLVSQKRIIGYYE